MDASAIVAVANEEPYIPELPAMFMDSIVTTINLAEALTALVKKFDIEPKQIWEQLSNFVPAHYPIDNELTYKVVQMASWAHEYGLSFGDRYCLALGKHLNLPVYTGDKIWKQLEKKMGVSINLIRP